MVVAVTGALVGVTFGHATADFSFTRFVGADRYGTAAVTARETFPASPNAVITTGERFPDALAGSYVASLGNAPVLLTRAEGLPQATIDALQAMGTRSVVILGGTGAVSAAVEAELAGRGLSTRRIAGTDRYHTARLAAESGGSTPVGSEDGKKTAILTNGENYPDALSTGPVSYAGRFPLLLTTPGSLSPHAKAALTALSIKQVLIPGGTAAVSSAVEGELRTMSVEIVRFSGANRSQTATLVADWALANMPTFSDSHVNLARGNDFADALAGGPHGGRDPAPVLLTASQGDLGDATRRWLRQHANTLEDGHIFGGTSAVSSSVESDAVAAARNTDPTTTTSPLPTLPGMPTTTTTKPPPTTTTTAPTFCPPFCVPTTAPPPTTTTTKNPGNGPP